MNMRATIVAAKTSPTGRNGLNPIPAYTARNNIAVSNSTAGYRAEIGCEQFLHFPRRIIQLNSGILSYGFIGVEHFGHAEFGNTIDSSFGTRWMTTLRKLPTAAPKTNTKI